MDDFINILRERALYIKIKSGAKFGGAVEIDSLLKALDSLNTSFQNYFNAEAKSQVNKKISKSVEKEITKLGKESKLLIVDLNFSSFAAGIAPNSQTIEKTYSSINDPLSLKKNVFEDYKSDVFYGDYSSDEFIKKIQNKFTADERAKIYRPLFENLFNQDKFKFHFGKDKTNIKRTLKGFTDKTIERLTPIPKKQIVPAERMYKVYMTTAGELDLFGGKPKVKKVLATEELQFPTYPYQLKDITWDGYQITLTHSISADVSYDEDASVYKITFPDLNIAVWGENRDEAQEAFQMAFVSLVQNFYEAADSTLTDKALRIKNILVSIIQKIKQS